MKSTSWENYSHDNLGDLLKVVSGTIKTLEKSIDKDAIKIPLSDLNGVSLDDAVLLLNSISDQQLTVLNEHYNHLLREIALGKNEEWLPKNKELKNAYYDYGFMEDDLERYVLLQLKSNTLLTKFKVLEKKILFKLAKQNITNFSVTKTWTKKDINRIIKQYNIINKEKQFLLLLSDLKPHDIRFIKTKISKNYAKLKERVIKKLEGTGWLIIYIKGSSINHGFYQLQYFLPLKTK